MLRLKNVDQEVIKDSNKKMILNILRDKREMTKQNIAKEIGVSIPTVISNINELITEGLVEEAGVGDSSGGRKPVIVKFKPDSKYAFGVEVNLHNIRVILINLDAEVLEEETFSTDRIIEDISKVKNIDGLIDSICDCIQKIIKRKTIDINAILGVGISLPGTVNEEKLVLEWAPNLSVRDVSFEKIRETLGFSVYLENEANAAAIAELKLGVAKDMRNLVYISITEGMGTGIVVQDYLYKGKNKKAGEFGHMTIIKDGRPCKCGKKGCWEQYASQAALIQSYNKSPGENIADLKEFFNKLEDKEITALKVWEEYLEYLAAGIQNIILILDPHYIVIGGKVSNYEKFLIEALKEKVFIKNSFFSSDDIKIFTSKLKSYSSVMGAALLPMQKLFYLNNNIL